MFWKTVQPYFFRKKTKKTEKEKICIYRFAECFLCISCLFWFLLKNKSQRRNEKYKISFFFSFFFPPLKNLVIFFFSPWRKICVLFFSSLVRKFVSPRHKDIRKNPPVQKNIHFFFVKKNNYITRRKKSIINFLKAPPMKFFSNFFVFSNRVYLMFVSVLFPNFLSPKRAVNKIKEKVKFAKQFIQKFLR